MTERVFGPLLRGIRENAGISMGRVARHLGVTVPYVSDVERGQRAPWTKAKIIKAAELLGVDPGDLLSAASRERGAFELEADVSPKAQEVGAALARGWKTLTDDELEEIGKILGGKR